METEQNKERNKESGTKKPKTDMNGKDSKGSTTGVVKQSLRRRREEEKMVAKHSFRFRDGTFPNDNFFI